MKKVGEQNEMQLLGSYFFFKFILFFVFIFINTFKNFEEIMLLSVKIIYVEWKKNVSLGKHFQKSKIKCFPNLAVKHKIEENPLKCT